VAEQILHLADIHTPHEHVRGETVAKGMNARMFHEPRPNHGLPHDALQNFFADRVAADCAGPGVDRQPRRREDILPPPLPRGFRIKPLRNTRKARKQFRVNVLHNKDRSPGLHPKDDRFFVSDDFQNTLRRKVLLSRFLRVS